MYHRQQTLNECIYCKRTSVTSLHVSFPFFFSTVNTYKILTVSQDSKYFLQTIKEGCLRKVLIEKMDTRSTVHLMRCKKSSHLFQQSHYFDSKD